jgi:hypothetical protein
MLMEFGLTLLYWMLKRNNKDCDEKMASSSRALCMWSLIENHMDVNGMLPSSSRACRNEFLIEANKDSHGNWASSVALYIEFLRGRMEFGFLLYIIGEWLEGHTPILAPKLWTYTEFTRVPAMHWDMQIARLTFQDSVLLHLGLDVRRFCRT